MLDPALDAFAVGIESIDLQHRELRALTEELLLSTVADKSEGALLRLLGFLTAHVFEHLQAEEEWMRLARYGDAHGHAEEHARFREVVRRLTCGYSENGGSQELALEVVEVVLDWFRRHVHEADRALGRFLASDAP